MNILLLNGPNLNMLGQREPDKYGTQTLQDIVDDLQAQAASSNVTLTHFQSNAEFELIDRVHAAMGTVDAIIINPAAFTHTSV
ncbi:MAG: type II 3-dehydroquinate dehydratase, partial [Pseudomonadota bacterium]|nr:type II 3-dehydroquinate dehydratase [Pseudomonadota bacterium]